LASGQTPPYTVGQRIGEQIRDSNRVAEGAGFDIKEFYRKALEIDSVGLDTL
jgi:uncharacterized protein (DUF885 family)